MKIRSTVVFTSVTRSYLQKAALLAQSLKEFHPSWHVALLQVDAHSRKNADPPPESLTRHFDERITLHDLRDIARIPNLSSWLFRHDSVELCTAVKGAAFKHLLARRGVDQVIYLDPDILVFSSLDSILREFRKASILLTPHLTEPEKQLRAIATHECGVLKHGIYNLGFLGVKNSAEGRRFVNWWTDRLIEFCYIDPGKGLFTDQKWANLIPSFFPDHKMLTDPGLNIAYWNVGQRDVKRVSGTGFLARGVPLKFFHYSGFDAGRHDGMVERFHPRNRAVKQLTNIYRMSLGSLVAISPVQGSPLERFSDGEPITREHRVVYRQREDLWRLFPNPYRATSGKPCYLSWYRDHAQDYRRFLP